MTSYNSRNLVNALDRNYAKKNIALTDNELQAQNFFIECLLDLFENSDEAAFDAKLEEYAKTHEF